MWAPFIEEWEAAKTNSDSKETKNIKEKEGQSMEKYIVKLSRVYHRYLVVEAENSTEALSKLNAAVAAGQIDVTMDTGTPEPTQTDVLGHAHEFDLDSFPVL